MATGKPKPVSRLVESGNKSGRMATPKEINKALTSKPKSNAGAGAAKDIVDHITQNYRVTAKEAGDIVKKVADYAKNSGTQVGQAAKAVAKSVASNYSPSTLAAGKGSTAEAKNKAAGDNARKQVGQAIGAVTQNRKYKD